MPENSPYLSFNELQDLHSFARAKYDWAKNMDERQFSQFMNRSLGTDAFRVGDTGPLLRTASQMSAGLDTLLQPASEATGEALGGLGSLVGPKTEAVAREFGKSLPRTAGEIGLLAGASAAAPVLGPVAATALGATAIGSAGLRGFTEHGSKAGAAFQAAALPLTGVGMGLGRRKAAEYVAKPLGEMLESYLGRTATKNLVEKPLEYGGSLLGALTAQETANEASSKAAYGQFYNPLAPEHLGPNLAATAMFGIMDIPMLARGYKMPTGAKRPEPVGFTDLMKPKIPGQYGSYSEYLRDFTLMKNVAEHVAETEAKRAPATLTPENRDAQLNLPTTIPTTSSKPKDKVTGEVSAINSNQNKNDPVTSAALPSGVPKPPSFTTLEEAVDYVSRTGWTGMQLWKILSPELQEKVPGANAKEKVKYLRGAVEKQRGPVSALAEPLKQLPLDWRITVQEDATDQGKVIAPGYVQIDVVEGGKNIRSTNIEQLRKEGYAVPNYKTFLKQGVYTVEQAEALRPRTAAKWTEGQTQAGFGSLAVEQLNEDMPFGYRKAADGTIPTSAAKAGMEKLMTKDELGIYKDAGLEEFLKSKGTKVSTEELQKWMLDNGPKLKVRVLESGTASSSQVRQAELRHWYDGLSEETRAIVDTVEHDNVPEEARRRLSPSDLELAIESANVEYYGTEGSSFDPDVYRTITPHHGPQVVGLVRVPAGKVSENYKKWLGSKPDTDEMRRRFGESPLSGWIKYRGGHFGQEDVNVLSFFRGYWTTSPDGKKTFVVFEVQKDWGEPYEVQGGYKVKGDPHDKLFATEQEARKYGDSLSPLLRHANRLALKSAVKYAIDNGAEKITIVDAETAMMTEGHDRQIHQGHIIVEHPDLAGGGDKRFKVTNKDTGEVRYFNSRDEADVWINTQNKIPQEPGMRLNYDKLLPTIVKELTGEEGVRTEFGEHAGAYVSDIEGGTTGGGIPRSDLIFKNPDGTPKTSITGAMFDLRKAKEELLRRGGYSFFGKDKLLTFLARMETEGKSPDQIAEAMIRMQGVAARKGESILDYAARISGLDESFNRPNEPGELLRSTQQFFRWLFWSHGEPTERAEYLTRQAMNIVARFEPLASRTKLALAKDMTFTTIFGRGGLFNTVMAIKDIQRAAPEMQLYELFHGLGHESFHALEDAISLGTPEITNEANRAYNKAYAASHAMTPEQRVTAITTLIHFFAGPNAKYADMTNTNTYGGAKGAREFLADFAGLLAMGSVDPNAHKELGVLMRWGDYDTTNFGAAIYRDLTAVTGVVKDLLSRLNKMAFGQDAKRADAAFGEVYENLQSLMRTREEAEHAVSAFLAMQERREATPISMPPVVTRESLERMNKVMQLDHWLGQLMNEVPESVRTMAKEVTDEADDLMIPKSSQFKPRPNFWDKLTPIPQLVRKFPQLKEAFDLAWSYIALSTENTLKLWNRFVDDKGRIDYKRIEQIGKEKTPRNTAFNEIALVENAREERLSKEEREKLSPSYKALSAKDREIVDRSLDQFSEVVVQAGVQRVEAQRVKISKSVARVVQSHMPKASLQEVEAAADAVVDVVFEGMEQRKPQSPERAAKIVNGQLLLQQMGMNPTALDSAMKVAQENYGGWDQLRVQLLGEKLEGKPYYKPEVRLGEWHIAWQETGKDAQLWDFKYQVDAAKKLRELQKLESEGKLEYLKPYNRSDKANFYRGAIDQDLFRTYADAEKRLFDSVSMHLSKENPLYEDAMNDLRAAYQPGDAAAQIVTSPYMMPRELVGGRERLNFVEGLVHYIDATSHGISKGFVKTKQALVLNSPEIRGNTNLQTEARKYLSFVTDPQGQEFTTLKNLIFFNFLGLNPSSLFVESSQQFLTLVPHLVREGSTVTGAYKAMMSSWPMIGKAAMKAQKLGVSMSTPFNQLFDDVVVDKNVKRAISERVVDMGIIQDLYAEQDVDFVNMRNLFSGGGDRIAFKDLLGKPAYQVLGFARQFYGLATKFNSLGAFISSFEFARKTKGMSEEKAYQFAKDSTPVTMFGGGRISRPLAIQNWGTATGVGGLMYSLQSYTFSMLSFMARLTKESIGKQGLKPEEAAAARKAAGLMFGTQFLLGGVMGLPLVAAGVALIEQFYPEAEIKKNLRKAFVGLAGDDEAMGHMIADGAMNGVMNLTAADFGSRFQLGNMLGVSPYEGFSWKNLIGPSASMMENYAKGAQHLAQGDVGEAVENFSPAGVRGMARLANDGWVVRDQNERLIFEPTGLEKGLIAAGFKPKRLNQYYEQQAIQLRSERNVQQERQDFYVEMAKFALRGEYQKVRDELAKKQREWAPYDVQEGIRRVTEVAQGMTTPRDLSRDAKQDTVGLYPTPPVQSETQRLLSRQQLGQQLGLPPSANHIALRAAQLVDQLRASNPNLSYQQALRMVEQALHPRSYRRRFGEVGQ